MIRYESLVNYIFNNIVTIGTINKSILNGVHHLSIHVGIPHLDMSFTLSVRLIVHMVPLLVAILHYDLDIIMFVSQRRSINEGW